MVNEDKGNLSNFRNYVEELEMLEDWLINLRIDKDDCLMFDESIGKKQITGKTLNYFIIQWIPTKSQENNNNFKKRRCRGTNQKIEWTWRLKN